MPTLAKRYKDAKKASNGALCIFRMGDFYELFYDDAKTASQTLGLTLTSRDKQTGNPIPMAGFPHHQLETYKAKLLKEGHEVSVLE